MRRVWRDGASGDSDEEWVRRATATASQRPAGTALTFVLRRSLANGGSVSQNITPLDFIFYPATAAAAAACSSSHPHTRRAADPQAR